MRTQSSCSLRTGALLSTLRTWSIGTWLVADRSAGVAVVIADDEPGAGGEALAELLLPREHRGGRSVDEEDRGSARSPKVWTHTSTPFAWTIFSLPEYVLPLTVSYLSICRTGPRLCAPPHKGRAPSNNPISSRSFDLRHHNSLGETSAARRSICLASLKNGVNKISSAPASATSRTPSTQASGGPA